MDPAGGPLDDLRVKLCTVCGVVTSRAGSRCAAHVRRSSPSRHSAVYRTRAWQRLSARVLRAWRGERGDWCPGYRRPAHRASDLTVDHVVPLAAGGAPFDIANMSVLCRSCNSSKGASTGGGGVDPMATGGLQTVPARPANVVVLALVAALLDLEQRRGRGKVRPPMDCERSA